MSSTARRRSSGQNGTDGGEREDARRLSTSSAKGKGREVFQEDQEEEADRKPEDEDAMDAIYDSDEDESLHCAICLSVIDDRTVIQPCNHGIWSSTS